MTNLTNRLAEHRTERNTAADSTSGAHLVRRLRWLGPIGIVAAGTPTARADDMSYDATLKDIEQADLTDAQARSDIQLLVERQWRAVDNARRQFMAFDAHLAEGDELLRLRRAGLREGTSTALALIDAETRQAQRRTERAQIAYQYTQALAGLLHASGQPRDITRYLARPDAVFIKPTDAPAP